MSHAESRTASGDDAWRSEWKSPRLSRRAIWLPAALTALILFLIAVASLNFGRRIEAHRRVIVEILEPTRSRVDQLGFNFAVEVTSIRSYALLPRASTAERFRNAHSREALTMRELKTTLSPTDPEFASQLAELETTLARWRVVPIALVSGRLSTETFRQRLPTEETIVREIVAQLLSLETLIARRTDARLAAIRVLERSRLAVLAALSILALFSAALSVWFGERARSLALRHQRLGAALEEKRLLLAAVLEQMPAGVSVVEVPSGRSIHQNRQTAEIWRIRGEDDPGIGGIEDYGDVVGFHPDGRRYRSEEWPIARSILTGEVVEGEDIEIRRFDGTRGVIRVSSAPIRDSRGEMVAAVATLYDVSDQKAQEQDIAEAEKRARFLAEAAQVLSGSLEYEETLRRSARLAVPFFADIVIAYLLDRPDHIRQVAAAHQDPEKQALLEEFGQAYRPDPTNPRSVIWRAVHTGEPVLLSRIPADIVDALEFGPRAREIFAIAAPVSMIAVPLVARDTKLGTLLFISAESQRTYGADDLSLAQQLASQAALAVQNAKFYQEVQDALRTRDEVLGVVSHDLRNPLHTIGMSTELLLDVPLDDSKRRGQLEVIQRAKQRMERLINDLLDVARIETGKALAIERRSVSVPGLMREVCESNFPQAREKGVRLELLLPANLPRVYADPGRIMQVLSNLIGNALKVTPEGGQIDVVARQLDNEVQISVRDTGSGIPEEDLDRIFLPFWQAPPSKRKGAGLGLAISHGIIQQHGGRIWVESRVGEGSTFSFTLPVANASDQRFAAD